MATEKWKQEHQEEMRSYRRKYYRTHKKQHHDRVVKGRRDSKKFIYDLKATLTCSRCPENDPRCLDFHHDNPKTKEVSISQSFRVGWSRERILKEIAKCIVLCANCHRKEHYQ